MTNLHVDCGTCSVRGLACGDCVVTVLLGAPADWEIDQTERAALGALSDGGLVPPLRLVSRGSAPDTPPASVPALQEADEDPADARWRRHG